MAKREILIKLSVNEILYDVRNKTHILGRTLSNGENYEAVYNMQAIDDEENINQVWRSMSSAFESLKSSVSEYLAIDDSPPGSASAINEPLDSVSHLTFEIHMPMNFDSANMPEYITCIMHDFIVSSIISDWYSLTSPERSQEYATQAASSLTLLDSALGKRQRPVRPF